MGPINVSNSKTEPANVTLIGDNKEQATVTDNALNVRAISRHTSVGDAYFSQPIGVPYALAVDAVINEYEIALITGHGVQVGEQLIIWDEPSDRLYTGNVLAVVTNDITLDTPLDFSYPSATAVGVRTTTEMNVDGSVTRQTFSIGPPTATALNITRVMFKMITTDPTELDMFGDIAGGLARGLIFRVVNGTNTNYFNVKTNGDLVNIMYDVTPYEAAKVFGSNGLGGRLTYGSEGKHGCVIRLEQDDTLEMIVSDDLGDLLSLQVMASWNVAEEL